MDALITYGGDRVGYSAMRSLAGLGLKVAVADPSRVGLSQFSRFCAKKYVLKHPFNEPEAFVDDVIRILQKSGARFLLPTQAETELLAQYRDRFPPDVMLPLDDIAKIKMANNKFFMGTYAKDIGLNVPEEIEWSDLEELEDRLASVKFKVVVKLREGYSANWVFYPRDSAEAFAICRDLVAGYSLSGGRLPIVQRRVFGEGWGVSSLYHEGRKLASFTHHRLRQNPPTGGSSTLRVSARNGIVEAYTDKLLESLAWHGIAMVEFKVDPVTGEAWFMEVNPRLWGSIALSVAAGVDLVKLLYVANTDGPDKALDMALPQREGVVCRWWLGDASLALSEARRFRLRRALKLLMPSGADACDEFRKDDPAAGIGALIRPAVKFLKGFARKKGTGREALYPSHHAPHERPDFFTDGIAPWEAEKRTTQWRH